MPTGDERRRDALVRAPVRRLQRHLNRAVWLQALVAPLWAAVSAFAVWRFLVRFQPEMAREMIGRLANILRVLLRDHDAYVPFRDELAFTDDYLGIEVVRFGEEKLKVVKEIDPETLEFLVPVMLLQPLIENSIKHGLEPRLHGGTVTLRSRIEHEKVVVEVEDDGVGMPEGWAPAHGLAGYGSGIGMRNVRARLQVLYGSAALFEVISSPGRGTRVTIELPVVPSGLVFAAQLPAESRTVS